MRRFFPVLGLARILFGAPVFFWCSLFAEIAPASQVMSSQSSRRHRSDTVDTAGTLTSIEKARLLEEMPSYHDDDDEDDADDDHANGSAGGAKDNSKAGGTKPSGHDSSSSSFSFSYSSSSPCCTKQRCYCARLVLCVC